MGSNGVDLQTRVANYIQASKDGRTVAEMTKHFKVPITVIIHALHKLRVARLVTVSRDDVWTLKRHATN